MSRWRAVAEAVVLAAAMAVATFLRFDGLGVPSFWLDEALGQQLTTAATAQRWGWLTGFDPEHGPLYYATQLATRVFGEDEFAARLAAALFGVLTIPLAWLIARRFSRTAAAACAILLAVSPLHVYYSREARPYALLMMLTGAFLALVVPRVPRSSSGSSDSLAAPGSAEELRGTARNPRNLVLACLLLLGMLYTTAVAASVMVSVMIGMAVAAVAFREHRRFYGSIAGFAAVALALFPVIYAARPAGDPNWPRFPELDLAFFASLVRSFSVTALEAEIAGRAAVAMLLFAIVGMVVVARRREGLVLIGMTILPLVVALVALRLFDHFYAARYVLPALIGYVILASIGIASVARIAGERIGAVLTVGIAIVTAAQGWDSARTEPFRKLDWRGIAGTIAAYARPGDLVLAAEQWTEVSLRYYLDRQPNPPKLVQMPYVELADRLRLSEPATWLVTAGFDDSPMRRWMCNYPMVLAAPLENFRLHYASVNSDFLRERGTGAELRALNAALGETGFALRTDETRFYGEGWAAPEETFRWAVGTRATLSIPRWGAAATQIRLRVLPFEHPSLPAQVLRASLNGKPLGEIMLAGDWSEPSFDVPAGVWKNGWNELTFTFGRANAPAELDSRAQDDRLLAACFDWIAVGDAVEPSLSPVYATRIATVPDSRDSARRASRGLLGRLGLDPELSIGVEDAAETLAYGEDCDDAEAFLLRAFRILLERPPNDVERSDLLGRMRKGATRAHIIGRILKADDFGR